ncbi:GNAT family N-acetyltransferase [Mangrovimonas sp. ST2L15]|uniref:GNAT family N-acetyltransferase n=1 Tax=Mangrovimonas sp. ST2L15 TaxID=1645916 RepID=UPI0009E89E40|nr:GNAT family N-acetyltransferase [Mangrovimonas sp. ST2L15]
MSKSPLPILRTKRLLLRALKSEDWEMISFLRSDPKINEFVDRPKAETKEAALAFINKIINPVDGPPAQYWGICLQPEDSIIGTVCLWNFSEDRTQAELGYDLNYEFQGKGYMNECLNEILRYGFQDLNLKEISAMTHYNNAASIKVLERLGFLKEANSFEEDPNLLIFRKSNQNAQ